MKQIGGNTRRVGRPIPVLTSGLAVEDESRLVAESMIAGISRGQVARPGDLARELIEEQAAEDFFHVSEVPDGFQPVDFADISDDDAIVMKQRIRPTVRVAHLITAGLGVQ